MVTKAELEEEVKLLREKLQQRDAEIAARRASRAAPSPPPTDPLAALGIAGLSAEEIEEALNRVAGDVARLHQRQPFLSVLAAFGAGIVLSRILK